MKFWLIKRNFQIILPGFIHQSDLEMSERASFKQYFKTVNFGLIFNCSLMNIEKK